MTTQNPIPTYSQPLTEGKLTSRAWYRFFQGLYQTLGPGSVTSVGLAPGSTDITVGSPNPVTSSGNIPIDLSATVKADLALAASSLQSISIATGTGLAGGPLGATGSTVALNSTSIANLALAATALQPVTGLSGSYTYASLTLNASGQITAVASGTAPAGAANPSGTVGLAVVNGVATTYLRSDGAPALSQGITPTWTAKHTFNAGVAVGAVSGAQSLTVAGSAGQFGSAVNGSSTAGQSYGHITSAGTNSTDICWAATNQANNIYYGLIRGDGSGLLGYNGSGATITFAATGAVTYSGSIGVNGASPPAKVTGWGTPTGAAVVANFNGASASLVNCSNAIAELITILKNYGLIGA